MRALTPAVQCTAATLIYGCGDGTRDEITDGDVGPAIRDTRGGGNWHGETVICAVYFGIAAAEARSTR